MTIAYLINQYPKVSHSFIRREIAGVEASGLSVARFSIRSCETELVDPADKLELEKTRVVLDVGLLKLMLYLLGVALTRPIAWLKTLWLAVQVGQRSDRGVLRHFIYLAEACVLLRWFQAAGVTHVHAHFGTNSTTVAMLCRSLGGAPYSFTVHGPEEFDRPESLALTEKINRAAFVVAISSFGRSQLYRWCDYQQWAKIHVVRCGVDEQFLQQPFRAIVDRPTLVCVGRLCEQKGQLLLVQAVHQLKVSGIPCHLTLVGDGEMRPQIETLIQQSGLTEQVTITGWASGAAVQKFVSDARALVLPSFAEGLPVVLMEAMALGRPVLSTYVAGIPELVEPEINGWLVPASSVEALVKAMQTILQLPIAQLEQMGKAGITSVARQHDVTVEAGKLVRLFLSEQSSTRTVVSVSVTNGAQPPSLPTPQ
jgi:glycosyltransferase involved in cell wall biosynthesis